MVFIRRTTLLLIVVLLGVNCYSQEMLGIVNSNYAGSNAILINPASLTNSKVYLDINVITANVFLDNNYLYIHNEDYSLGRYLKKDPVFPEYGDKDRPFDRYDNDKLKYAYSNIRVIGPSAMLTYNDHTFAIQTQVRSVFSGDNIPYDVANFAYEGLNFPPQYNINYNDNDFSMGAMVWGEINLSYAYVFHKYSHDHWSAGITLKYLMGYGSGFVDAENLDYLVLNDSTADIRNLRATAGFSLPLNYNNNDFPDGPTFKGNGLGFDLGITYTKTIRGHSNKKYRKLCRQPYNDYYYRIGVSLLDIGSIKFDKSAQLHDFDDVSHYWERIDTLTYHDINTFVDELSTRFYGNSSASLKADNYSVALPSAVSLQIDYHYYKNWYFNGTFIYPLKLLNNSILVRPPQIAITPRYESAELEFNFPVSLYNYTKLRIGLAARYKFITIGTDKLGSFFGFSDYTGMDIYASIKFNFRKGWCGFSRPSKCLNNEYGKYRKR